MKLLAKNFSDVHSFSTFFYLKLSSGGYKAVCHWAKGIDMVSLRLLLFPVHLETHWCLATVDIPNCLISYYDSLGNDNQTCLEKLEEYMSQKLRNTKELSSTKWRLVCHHNIPKQENFSDCGVFICMFARCLAYNTPFNFSQADIPSIRRHIVLELLSKQLIN